MIMKRNCSFFIKLFLVFVIIFGFNSVSMKKVSSKIDNESINKNIDLVAKAQKEEEFIKNDIYSPIDYYNGFLTGYVANCPACTGYLGCNGQNVLDGTTTYFDDMYGEVFIVASSSNLPCGSIVEFDFPNISSSKIVAIVLDRGVLGTNLDLLVESEEFAINNIGGKLISYNVLRRGYSR